MSEDTPVAPLDSDPAADEPVTPVVLQALVDIVAPLLTSPVDELHVAALLESRGVTDRLARERYGHEDVFALATALMPALTRPVEEDPVNAERVRAWRALIHGPLYLAPSLVIPALLGAGDRTQLLIGLVSATVVGWLWGMATSVVGYQLRGLNKEATGAWAVQLMTAGGLVFILLVGIGLAVIGAVTVVVVVAMSLQTAFQLGAGLLIFYRREIELVLAVVPAVVAGAVYLETGSRAALIGVTLAAAALTSLLTLGAAWRASRRAMAVADATSSSVHISLRRTIAPPVAYAAVSALLLLFTDVHFVTSGPELALAAAPLVLGMGGVEWRAERFVEGAGDLLGRTSDVAPFRSRLWAWLGRELGTVLAILLIPAALLVAWLHTVDRATPQSVLLSGGHVALGGAFFLCFVLSRHGHFPWIVGAIAAVVIVYVAAVVGAGNHADVVVPLFLATATTLVLVLLGAFAGGIRNVQLFMW
jgi:hypothetical protein